MKSKTKVVQASRITDFLQKKKEDPLTKSETTVEGEVEVEIPQCTHGELCAKRGF